MHVMRDGQDGLRNGQAAPRAFWNDALAQHGPWLRQVISLRVGEAQAVDEVWQEVACQVLRLPHGFVVPANVGGWLYRVAIRQALQYRRRAGRHRRFIRRYAERGASALTALDPLGWLVAAERQELVRQALTRLPVRDAQVLVLKYTQDWSYQQIAAQLDLSVSAVETRLHRARQRLRELLARLEHHEDDHERH